MKKNECIKCLEQLKDYFNNNNYIMEACEMAIGAIKCPPIEIETKTPEQESFRWGYMRGYAQGQENMLNECIEIVDFHKDSWDGTHLALADLKDKKERGE